MESSRVPVSDITRYEARQKCTAIESDEQESPKNSTARKKLNCAVPKRYANKNLETETRR
jgi:hypothetical protein